MISRGEIKSKIITRHRLITCPQCPNQERQSQRDFYFGIYCLNKQTRHSDLMSRTTSQAWQVHESRHEAWSGVHECAYAAASNFPKSSIMNVVTQALSANAVPDFCFIMFFVFFWGVGGRAGGRGGTSLRNPAGQRCGGKTFAEKCSIDSGQSTRFFQETLLLVNITYYAHVQTHCYVTALSEERGSEGCAEKLIMFLWPCTYSYSFHTGKRKRSAVILTVHCSLFTWKQRNV